MLLTWIYGHLISFGSNLAALDSCGGGAGMVTLNERLPLGPSALVDGRDGVRETLSSPPRPWKAGPPQGAVASSGRVAAREGALKDRVAARDGALKDRVLVRAVAFIAALACVVGVSAQGVFCGTPSVADDAVVHQNVVISKSEKTLKSQWAGKRVGILGDSMTDKRTLGPDATLWWEYLQQLLGFEATYVYGVSGHQWHQIYRQAEKLYAEHAGEVDAILIFAGTNDYNAGVPVGTFFTTEEVEVEVKGPKIETRTHRIPVMCDSTVCGRLNQALCYMKDKFPDAQIVVMTPIHRGYAKFNAKNVQPDEFYCNGQGLFLEDYVDLYKKAAAYWSVPVADLYGESGIVPNLRSNNLYINKPATDRLHPSTEGEYRIAKFMQYRLLSLPADF